MSIHRRIRQLFYRQKCITSPHRFQKWAASQTWLPQGGPEVKMQIIPSHNANTRKETMTMSADEIVNDGVQGPVGSSSASASAGGIGHIDQYPDQQDQNNDCSHSATAAHSSGGRDQKDQAQDDFSFFRAFAL